MTKRRKKMAAEQALKYLVLNLLAIMTLFKSITEVLTNNGDFQL